jgi:hypothetical protein
MGGNIMANIISSDLDPVTDNLNTAREALQNKDTTEAFNALSVLLEMNCLHLLTIWQAQIDQAQDGLQRSDLPNALEALNFH